MSPASQAASRVAFYIDGFNLFFGMRDSGWKKYYWLDLVRLCESLLRPDQQLASVQYFTSIVSPTASDPHKGRRQQTYLDALRAKGGLLILLGNYLSRATRCHRCGGLYFRREEKKTDVNIAVAVLTDLFQNRFDTAIIVSGDSDLAPVANAVRRLSPEKRVVIGFPPRRNSGDLRKAASGFFKIGESSLRKNQLPRVIPTVQGYVIHRPPEWH